MGLIRVQSQMADLGKLGHCCSLVSLDTLVNCTAMGFNRGSAIGSRRCGSVEQAKGLHVDLARLWNIKPKSVETENVRGFD